MTITHYWLLCLLLPCALAALVFYAALRVGAQAERDYGRGEEGAT